MREHHHQSPACSWLCVKCAKGFVGMTWRWQEGEVCAAVHVSFTAWRDTSGVEGGACGRSGACEMEEGRGAGAALGEVEDCA